MSVEGSNWKPESRNVDANACKISEWGIVNLDIPKMKTKGGNTNITRKNANNEKQRKKGKI